MVADNELNDQPTRPSLNGIPIGNKRRTSTDSDNPDDDLNLDYKVRKKSYAHLIDPTLPPEEARKQRRAISNRESAKRARLRKELEVQELREALDNVQAEVVTLKTENSMLRQYIRSLTEANAAINAAGNSLANQFSRSVAAAAGAGAPSPNNNNNNGGNGGGGANTNNRRSDGTVLRGSPISQFPTTASQLLAQLQLPPLTLQHGRGGNTGGGGGAQQQQQEQQQQQGGGGGIAKSSFSLLPWDQINQSIPEEILKTLQDDTFLANI
jgi:hypothetical protein